MFSLQYDVKTTFDKASLNIVHRFLCVGFRLLYTYVKVLYDKP